MADSLTKHTTRTWKNIDLFILLNFQVLLALPINWLCRNISYYFKFDVLPELMQAVEQEYGTPESQ